MKLRPLILRSFFWLAVFGLLFACESEKAQETEFVRQQNYFLQAVELVESAGQILQGNGLNRPEIDQAMQRLDQGLQKAYEVRRDFLQRIDVRLPKLFPELFIKGVETYRIGVEGSDRAQQLEGLRLIRQWSQFWRAEKAGILNKLLGSYSAQH